MFSRGSIEQNALQSATTISNPKLERAHGEPIDYADYLQARGKSSAPRRTWRASGEGATGSCAAGHG
jgi:hypothetical protein